MKRSRPKPENLAAAAEHARQKRIEVGLPEVDPDSVAYFERIAEGKRLRAAKAARKRKTLVITDEAAEYDRIMAEREKP